MVPKWIEDLPGRALPAWIEALDARADAALGDPQRAYRRPGSALALTAEQWVLHDQALALQERQRARFGDAAERLAGTAHPGPVFGVPGTPRVRVLL